MVFCNVVIGIIGPHFLLVSKFMHLIIKYRYASTVVSNFNVIINYRFVVLTYALNEMA